MQLISSFSSRPLVSIWELFFPSFGKSSWTSKGLTYSMKAKSMARIKEAQNISFGLVGNFSQFASLGLKQVLSMFYITCQDYSSLL